MKLKALFLVSCLAAAGCGDSSPGRLDDADSSGTEVIADAGVDGTEDGPGDGATADSQSDSNADADSADWTDAVGDGFELDSGDLAVGDSYDDGPGTDAVNPGFFGVLDVPSGCVVGRTCEIKAVFDHGGVNPYDPDQIALDCEIKGPDGGTHVRPGFYFQNFVDDGGAPGQPDGQPDWRVRILPETAGTWNFRLVVRNPEATVYSAWNEITVEPAAVAATSGNGVTFQADDTNVPDTAWHGVLQASPKDERYLAFGDGTPYFPVGENLAWYGASVKDYVPWLEDLAGVGANYIRVWMATWGFSPEWSYPDGSVLGDYSKRQDRAWALDRLFDWTADRGIMMMLCLFSHGQFSTTFNSEWSTNPYRASNGGPLADDDPASFFTDEQAKRLVRNRIRYVVARWGAEPSLMAWELFNEVDLTEQRDAAILGEWHAEMAAELKDLDPYGHLVTTSTSDLASVFGIDQALYSLPDIDVAQVHAYGNNIRRIDPLEVIPERAATFAAFNKPVLMAELGVDSRGPNETRQADPYWYGLHDILWAPLFALTAGSGMTWWWDNLIHPEGQFSQFLPVAAFVGGIDWPAESFASVEIPASGTSDPKVRAVAGKTTVLAWIRTSSGDYATRDETHIGDATVDLRNIPAGSWSVRWVDPWGAVDFPAVPATVDNSVVSLVVPEFVHDIALRLTRVDMNDLSSGSPFIVCQ